MLISQVYAYGYVVPKKTIKKIGILNNDNKTYKSVFQNNNRLKSQRVKGQVSSQLDYCDYVIHVCVKDSCRHTAMSNVGYYIMKIWIYLITGISSCLSITHFFKKVKEWLKNVKLPQAITVIERGWGRWFSVR